MEVETVNSVFITFSANDELFSVATENCGFYPLHGFGLGDRCKDKAVNFRRGDHGGESSHSALVKGPEFGGVIFGGGGIECVG